MVKAGHDGIYRAIVNGRLIQFESLEAYYEYTDSDDDEQAADTDD